MRKALLVLLVLTVSSSYAISQEVLIEPPPGSYHQEVSLEAPPGTWEFRFEGSRLFRRWDRPITLTTLPGDERRFVLEAQPEGNPGQRRRLVYTIDRRPPVAPEPTPAPGIYRRPVEIEFEADEGRILYQISPGSERAVEYRGAVSLEGVAGTVTEYEVRVVAVDDRGNTSDPETYRFVLDRSEEEAAYLEVVSPVAGEFANQQLLYIVSRGLEELRYTLDGRDPERFGDEYVGPVLIAREGGVRLRVAGRARDGELYQQEVSYEGGTTSVVSASQGYHNGALFLNPQGQRAFRYRLEDSPVSRTDAVLTRTLELRPIPGALRPVILRLNDRPGSGSGDYRYTFLLDDRSVNPPLIHLFRTGSRQISLAVERESTVETEYSLLIDGRPYRSGRYEEPLDFALPDGVSSGEAVVRARSRSGSGPWTAYSEERFVFSTAPPEGVELEISPQGAAPAKQISFGRVPEGSTVRYELREITEPERRVTSSSGVLEDGSILTVPYGTNRRFMLSYAVFDGRGNASEERSLELRLDREPPAEPEILVENGRLRIRGNDETLFRVIPDSSAEIPDFAPYQNPVVLQGQSDARTGYTIEAFTRDEIGNNSAIISQQLFIDERSLQVPRLLGVEDGGRYSGEVVSLELTRPLPGLQVHYTLSTDGTLPPTPSADSPVLEEAVEIFGTEGETVPVHLRLRVRDPETGRYGPTRELRFVIDRRPPELPTLIGVENGGDYRGGRRLVLTGLEDDSTAYIALGTGLSDPFELLNGENEGWFAYEEPLYLDVEEGQRREFSMAIRVRDTAGNETTSAFPTTFAIDRQAPGAPEVSVEREGDRTVLRLVGEDQGAIFYTLSRSPQLPGIPGDGSNRYTGPIPLEPGRYYVAAVEIDPAGNRGPTVYSSELPVFSEGPGDDLRPVLLTSWEASLAVLIWPEVHRRDLYFRFPDSGGEWTLYEEPLTVAIDSGQDRLIVEYTLDVPGNDAESVEVARPVIPGRPQLTPGEGHRSRTGIEVTAEGQGTLRYELSTVGPPESVSLRSPVWPDLLRLPGRDGESIEFHLAVRSFSDSGAGPEVRRTFVVDRAPPPAPRLINASDGEFYDDSRTVSFESEEGDVFYRVVRNPEERGADPDFEAYGGPVVLEAVTGELSNYRLEAYSVDAVGNRSPNTAAWNVYIDREIIYVAPGGSDRGSGTRESPFLTLGRAVEYARQSDRETIFLATGVYEISAPLRSSEALAIQGRFDPETWRPGSPGETLVIPAEDFVGEALAVSYRGPVTMSRLALSSAESFGKPLLLVDDVSVSLDSVALSSAGGSAVEARLGALTFREVTLEQSGASSEAVVLRGTTARIESSVIRAGSFGSERAIAVSLRDAASLTVNASRIEAYGLSRATAISGANSSLEVLGSTFRVGASRGNAQAISARDGGVLIESSVLEADDQTQVANLVVSRDASLAVVDSVLELSADQGAVGIVAGGGQIDVRGSRFLGTSLNDFTYGVQARGIEGVFVNNVFQAGLVGEYIAGSLVDSPSQWIHNTFLGFRASPFVQILNLRGQGQTLFGNNLAVQGAIGAGTGVVVANGHELEMRGNLFGGWDAIVTSGGLEIESLAFLESGRVEGIIARDNATVSADGIVGRDGVSYRLTPNSAAIDRGVELPGSEEVLFDIDGQRRPAPVPPDGSFRRAYEGRPDVGADEYYP